MTDKKLIYKTFNNQIKEFMNDIINVFPREVDLLTSRTFLEGIIKVKPRLLLEYWYKSIYLVYKVQIDNGDFDFFVNKNYDETECSDDVLKGIEKMRSIKNIVIGDIQPDLTFIFDIDPVIGIERTKKRNSEEDRFEKMDLNFHNNLREAFIEISKGDPDRFILIDAELDVSAISEIISNEVMNRLIL